MKKGRNDNEGENENEEGDEEIKEGIDDERRDGEGKKMTQ